VLLSLLILHACAIVITAVAAVWDLRTGHIPNWLTLPPLVIAPVAYFFLFDAEAALFSILGALICGVVPYFLFRMKTGSESRKAMHGGDVKLFASLGAMLGIYSGIEAQFFTVFVAAIYVMARMAWHGKLLRVLGNSLALVVNPLLPKKRRKDINPDLLHTIRLGGAIFVGTTIAVALRHPYLFPL
jgi:prepilin peptidase CpaA